MQCMYFINGNEDIKRADSPLWLPTSTHSKNLSSLNSFMSHIISIKPQTAATRGYIPIWKKPHAINIFWSIWFKIHN